MASVGWAQPIASGGDIITEDSYFYEDSPPVYPSPETSGLGTWAEAYSKAKALVSQMTLEEKVNLTAGSIASNGCSGNLPAIPRLGFPGMCLNDAGNGVRGTDFVTSWPSGLHVGASWNKELAYQRGMAMGREFKRKGVNMMLGPVAGPLGSVVEGGRNWEGFSVDPYLSGSLVSETVTGTQDSGVISSTKHFIGNEQETNRYPVGNVSSISSNIDDATLHELYLWPFQDALRAGSGNVMCSYNRVNNSYSCQNSKLLNGILKEELGFQGFVVTDWNGLHAGYDAALAGLDMAMPDSAGFWSSNLTESVKNGSISEARIDDMVTRTISSWYQMGQDSDFPSPGVGMPSSLTSPHEIVDARDPEAGSIAFQGAVEGHVLVKNINNTLPLQKPRMLSILGYSAKAPDQEMPSPSSLPWVLGYESSLAGFDAALVALLEGQPIKTSQIAPNGTIVSGGGSGATSQSTIISPFDALLQRASVDKTQLFWDFSSATPSIVPVSDACLVLGNAFASEGFDRSGIRDNYTDTLILSVAEQCANTIVILHNAGIRLVETWIDHPNVTAVIFAHLPGEESGNALVSLLYGECQFSGKLPYTVAKNESDYGSLLSPTEPSGPFNYFPQSDFTEGTYIDYRYFDRNNIEPRFEFGFGLSYTTFEYSSLRVETVEVNAQRSPYPTGPLIQGGQTDLWNVLTRITVDITNTGTVASSEVAQLYLGIPGGPAKQLRGFEKPSIDSGNTTTVTFELTRRDLSVWDVVAQKWKLQDGLYQVYVGSSSRSLPLMRSFSLCSWA